MIVVGFCFFGQGKGPEEWCWAGKGMEKGLGQIGKGLRDWVGVWGLVLAILTVLDDISQFTFLSVILVLFWPGKRVIRTLGLGKGGKGLEQKGECSGGLKRGLYSFLLAPVFPSRYAPYVMLVVGFEGFGQGKG